MHKRRPDFLRDCQISTEILYYTSTLHSSCSFGLQLLRSSQKPKPAVFSFGDVSSWRGGFWKKNARLILRTLPGYKFWSAYVISQYWKSTVFTCIIRHSPRNIAHFEALTFVNCGIIFRAWRSIQILVSIDILQRYFSGRIYLVDSYDILNANSKFFFRHPTNVAFSYWIYQYPTNSQLKSVWTSTWRQILCFYKFSFFAHNFWKSQTLSIPTSNISYIPCHHGSYSHCKDWSSSRWD